LKLHSNAWTLEYYLIIEPINVLDGTTRNDFGVYMLYICSIYGMVTVLCNSWTVEGSNEQNIDNGAK
jgi:hypothetical protein